MPASLLARITVHQGDALDSGALTKALLEYQCDGIINTAHNNLYRSSSVNPDHLQRHAAAAAVAARRTRGNPLRAWFIGGLGSLEYPNSGGWRIEDYMPLFTTQSHRETERVLKAIPTSELDWTLLCVAMMSPEKEGLVRELFEPKKHDLAVAAGVPPNWNDHWVRSVPLVGVYLNLIPVVMSYSTKLEDVADMIASQLEKSRSQQYSGQLVGMKEITKLKGA